jgi:xanthine dehydrogenase accessory factor
MRETKELRLALENCLKEEIPFVLAKVVSTQGSTYRKPGALALIYPNGTCVGLLSGGCLEQDVVLNCEELWHKNSVPGHSVAKLLRYDTSSASDIVMGLGLGCEGSVEIELCWHHHSSAKAVLKMLPEPLHVALCGAGEDHKVLADLMGCMGWNVSLVDRREGVLEHVGSAVWQKFLWSSEVGLPKADCYVIMNHHYETDRSQIHEIVNFFHQGKSEQAKSNQTVKPKYIGVLGPRMRSVRLFRELGLSCDELGNLTNVSPELVQVLRYPMGLDLGGDTPSAVAISVVAEIQAVAMGHMGGALTQKVGTIHS